MKCMNPLCEAKVTGTNAFCPPDYRRLPKELQRKLWQPLYGGAWNIRDCIDVLAGGVRP